VQDKDGAGVGECHGFAVNGRLLPPGGAALPPSQEPPGNFSMPSRTGSPSSSGFDVWAIDSIRRPDIYLAFFKLAGSLICFSALGW
jgi:hypothetical protein